VRDDEPPRSADNRRESPPVTEGVLRLTYDQIGKRLGMTADAARQLARRKGWPRTRPNAIGEPVVVSVPASELPSGQPMVHQRATDGEPSDDRRAIGGEPSVTGGSESPSVDRRSELHAQALAALEAALTSADTRTVEALALADRLAVQLADASARADAEIATLRDMADGLRDTVARAEHRAVQGEQRAKEAEAQLAAARLAADEVRAEAEEARQEAEARIVDLAAEASAKIAQAEAAADRARGVAKEAVQTAEALQVTVDGLKSGQATMQGAYAEELASAQREAEEAKEAAEALRQVAEARKARGRLRRAWDGWRGR
jgi:hypothetical protein